MGLFYKMAWDLFSVVWDCVYIQDWYCLVIWSMEAQRDDMEAQKDSPILDFQVWMSKP